ncbi:MAG: hypothetical protein M3406_04425 [Chloroflexota bacterium]|nr:hypothetical protein [Chloroflexota bacterium]
MTGEITLIYLEADDEVTSVVRRLRDTSAQRIVVVAPGRSRATSSVVALRLLARAAHDAERGLAVVGDGLTRSLAAEAGLDSYASIDDARNAMPMEPIEARTRRASIHVVRGDASQATAPTPAPIPAAPAATAWNDDRTQVRPRPTPRRPDHPKRTAGWRSRPAVAWGLGSLAVLLIGAGVVGAVVLPAATIEIVPGSELVDPVSYQIRIDEPDRVEGTVDAEAQVTATGTYTIRAEATVIVVFRNFNTADVAVGAGTLVAAGEQAFETSTDIVVPAGALTTEGTIQAGEGPTEAVAAAAGPAANVAAGAIDTILSQELATRLRGFPNNEQRLVTNPEAATGGVDTTGPEVTQQNVDDARAALLDELDAALAAALDQDVGDIFADAAEATPPVIEGIEGLVGMRDQEAAEISGTLAYDRLVVDSDEITELARARLAGDTGIVPEGHELLPAVSEVSIGEVRREGDTLMVEATVTGASTPLVDRDEVIDRVQGQPVDEARAALASLGDATIEAWPAWVTSIPTLDWRIDVTIVGEGSEPSSSASSAP